MKTINLSRWARKDQYLFFKDFDLPFFNICTTVEVGEILKFIKSRNPSFFITSLYTSLRTANEIEPFRYRIHGEDVVIHPKINAGSTVLNPDDTFSFVYFDYFKNFNNFVNAGMEKLKSHRQNAGGLAPKDQLDNVVHYSVLPWYSFSGVMHPRRLSVPDSVPKIVFGKYHREADKWLMPVSIEVHHALMDGFHIGKYLEHWQNLLDNPDHFYEE